MSDFGEVTPNVLRRRRACEKWKTAHREYYLMQKRQLATRPEYREHRRNMYRDRVNELKELGILPRKRGRPLMWVGSEALEVKRERARDAAARYRLKKISHQHIKDESANTSSCSSSDRSIDTSGGST